MTGVLHHGMSRSVFISYIGLLGLYRRVGDIAQVDLYAVGDADCIGFDRDLDDLDRSLWTLELGFASIA